MKYPNNLILKNCFHYITELNDNEISITDNIRQHTLKDCDSIVCTNLEEKRIDISIRIGDFLLLFENKIYESSIGCVTNEISGYYNSVNKKNLSLFSVIPIVIYPSSVNIPNNKIFIDDNPELIEICAISWKGEIKEIFEELKKDFNILLSFLKLHSLIVM